MIDKEFKFQHCKAELGRGHVSRCPRSWLITARAHARATGDADAALAFEIALDVQRSGSTRNPRLREMQRLCGRNF